VHDLVDRILVLLSLQTWLILSFRMPNVLVLVQHEYTLVSSSYVAKTPPLSEYAYVPSPFVFFLLLDLRL
jgi:hypothetical protein